MINQRLTTQREQSLGENLPIKKSMILNENVLFWDLDNSASTIRTTGRRKTELYEPRKSVTASAVLYPASTFLAKKLKRILQSHLLGAFNKFKDYRKTLINLSLLEQKKKRALCLAFFQIRLFHQLHKGLQLESVISRNKKPHLIYQSVYRVVRRMQKQALQNVLNLSKKKKGIQEFAIILQSLASSQLKIYYKKLFMRKMKSGRQQHRQRAEGSTLIVRLIPKIIRRIKLQCFNNVILGLKTKELQDTSLNKKGVTYKMNQASTERARALTNEREQIRNIKNDLDYYSADRSKARYEMRRDVNVQRTKLKQEEKRAKALTTSLSTEVGQLQCYLAQIGRLNEKRFKKTNVQRDKTNVTKLFIGLDNLEPNKLGQICPTWSKDALTSFNRQVEDLDEFHVHINQKLRQLIYQYENGALPRKNLSPAEEVLIEQNFHLKEIVQCIVRRRLENEKTKNNQHQIQK